MIDQLKKIIVHTLKNNIIRSTIMIVFVATMGFPVSVKAASTEKLYFGGYAGYDYETCSQRYLVFNDHIYREPKYVIKQDDGSVAVLEEMDIQNATDQTATVISISLELDDYCKIENPDRFILDILTGGDGDIASHIYTGVISPQSGRYLLGYSGDDEGITGTLLNQSLSDFAEVSSSVLIPGGEFGYFAFVIGFYESGLYTFHLNIEYDLNGTRYTESLPSISRYISLDGTFDTIDVPVIKTYGNDEYDPNEYYIYKHASDVCKNGDEIDETLKNALDAVLGTDASSVMESSSVDNSAEEIYVSFINDKYSDETMNEAAERKVALYDLNEDNIPELIFKETTDYHHYTYTIYSCENNKVQLVTDFSHGDSYGNGEVYISDIESGLIITSRTSGTLTYDILDGMSGEYVKAYEKSRSGYAVIEDGSFSYIEQSEWDDFINNLSELSFDDLY